MAVPFDFENHESPEGLHPELRLGASFATQISLDCEVAAIELARDIQTTKLTALVAQEAVYDKRFCELATEIGRVAFSDPVSEDLTPEAEAIKHGIITGRIFGRLICSGRALAQIQLESVEHVHKLFGPDSSRYDYEYWMRPKPSSFQEDASMMLRKRGIAPSWHATDNRTESLFYDSAAYFGANGIALHIANKTKLRTVAEHSAMRLQLKRWTKLTEKD